MKVSQPRLSKRAVLSLTRPTHGVLSIKLNSPLSFFLMNRHEIVSISLRKEEIYNRLANEIK